MKITKKIAKDVLLDFLVACLLVFVFFMLISEKAEAEPIPHPWDYATHAIGGAIIVDLAKPETELGVIAWTGAFGIAKEMTDQHFDNADAIAWVVGGLAWHYYGMNLKSKDGAFVLSREFSF